MICWGLYSCIYSRISLRLSVVIHWKDWRFLLCQKRFIERESMRDFPVRTTNTEKAIPYPVKRPFAWSTSPAIQTWNWWRFTMKMTVTAEPTWSVRDFSGCFRICAPAKTAPPAAAAAISNARRYCPAVCLSLSRMGSPA